MVKIQDKVVYQIYPKSFCDSNGDGIGDLNGIISRLDYLQDLGVDYIWLTPVYPSPQRDNGYDVADYCGIDPVYGTMDDFERLVKEAKSRGISLMMDMVFNHTSTQHEWFQKALAGDEKYIDYYIFREGMSDKIPTNWESKFGGSAWKYEDRLGKWYLHLFDETQADLNWKNENVRNELADVLKFWKTKGVEGFRFDVVNLISKPDKYEDDEIGDGRRFYTDGPNVHQFIKEMTKAAGLDEMMTVGEMSSTSIENCVRYSNPKEKELSMVFSFHHLKVDYPDGNKWELAPCDHRQLQHLFVQWQEEMQEKGGWNALFWCNHDQPRSVSRFGDDGQYRTESAKALALLTHMMRGTPYIYQGEELGMTNPGFETLKQYKDVESLNYYEILRSRGKSSEEAMAVIKERSRDNGRTPMQWDATENAGFTKGEPWISLSANYDEINAASQTDDPSSVYSFYKRLIRFRKEHEAVSDGTIRFAGTNAPDIYFYIRECENEKLAVIVNLSKEEREITADGEKIKVDKGQIVLSNYEDVGQDGLLRPYEAFVVKM